MNSNALLVIKVLDYKMTNVFLVESIVSLAHIVIKIKGLIIKMKLYATVVKIIIP